MMFPCRLVSTNSKNRLVGKVSGRAVRQYNSIAYFLILKVTVFVWIAG